MSSKPTTEMSSGDPQAGLAQRPDGPEGDDVAGDEHRIEGRSGASRAAMAAWPLAASKAASAISSSAPWRCRPRASASR